jgi:hypothetical protein
MFRFSIFYCFSFLCSNSEMTAPSPPPPRNLFNITRHSWKTCFICRTVVILVSIAGSEWCIFILGAIPRIFETAKYEFAKSEEWVYCHSLAVHHFVCHSVRGKIPYCRKVDMQCRVVYTIFCRMCGITELILFWGFGSSRICRRLKMRTLFYLKHQDPATLRRSDIPQKNGILSYAAVKTEQNRQCTYNATLRRFRVTIVAVESNKYYLFCVCVCSLSYPAWKTLVPYCIVICGLLSGCTIFLHIIS